MKAQKREQEYSFYISFTSALDGSGWLTTRPGRFTPGNEPLGTVRTGLFDLRIPLHGGI
jgi:hypothetical protein